MKVMKETMKETKNSKLAWDFFLYCMANPELRFWQALKNWSGYHRISAVTIHLHNVPEPNPLMVSGYSESHMDTYNWEGKRHDEVKPPS